MQKISHIDIVPFWETYQHILQTNCKRKNLMSKKNSKCVEKFLCLVKRMTIILVQLYH